jgi:DNA recombination protein RmuC
LSARAATIAVMDITTLLLVLLGLLAGAGLGWYAATGHAATESTAAERALREEIAATRAQQAQLAATLHAERAAAADKFETLRQAHAQAQEQLTERFKSLSQDALAANSQQFLHLAETRMQQASAQATGELAKRQQAFEMLVSPLKDTLTKVEQQLVQTETARVAAQAQLREQIANVRQSSDDLRRDTAALVTALRKPQTRGSWGEMHLRRVVEVAGMVEHCDFELQSTVTGSDGVTVRPDMIVRLAGGKRVVVDSKVPLQAFLAAADATDDDTRAGQLRDHARLVRTHIDQLSAKAYWDRLPCTPEFVVLFVPGEAFLAQALESDATLIEHAAARKVVLATPMTLIALLRTVAYAWTQEALADNARAVFELGRELYKRLGTLGEHVDALGRSLTTAVGTYNKVVGSLETRVLTTARKLNDLKVVEDLLPASDGIDVAPRALSAPELTLTSPDGGNLLRLPGVEEGDRSASARG